jgi:hypothetical protein
MKFLIPKAGHLKSYTFTITCLCAHWSSFSISWSHRVVHSSSKLSYTCFGLIWYSLNPSTTLFHILKNPTHYTQSWVLPTINILSCTSHISLLNPKLTYGSWSTMPCQHVCIENLLIHFTNRLVLCPQTVVTQIWAIATKTCKCCVCDIVFCGTVRFNR